MERRKGVVLLLLLFCCTAGCGMPEKDREEQRNYWQSEMNAGDAAGEQTEVDADDAAREQTEADAGGAAGVQIEGMIEEQSFTVELDEWGEVLFVSAVPEGKKGAPHFMLAKDGNMVYTFPESGRLKADDFLEVSAVSFTDYNGDGRKDVIALIRYQNGTDIWNEAQVFLQENPDNMFYLDHPDGEGYRLDAPSEEGPAFYRDIRLEEYLLTRGRTDTMSDLSGSWTEYNAYVNSLSGFYDTDAQVRLLAQQRDKWAPPVEFANDRYCFTVTDLDYDGRLEVIAANQGGTGSYTYSRFYEIDGEGNVKELENSFGEGDSQPDIMEEQMTVYRSFSPEEIRDHYIVYDQLKASPDCYVYRISSLCMVDDFIMETPLAIQTVTYEGEDYSAHTISEDCNGRALTEEEFTNFPEFYYTDMGLSKETVSIQWIDVSELAGKGEDETEELLRQAYEGFKRS